MTVDGQPIDLVKSAKLLGLIIFKALDRILSISFAKYSGML